MRKIILTILFGILLLAPAGNIWAGPMDGGVVQLVNPLGGTTEAPKGKTDVPQLIGTIIKGVLGVIGAVVLLMFVWGGFQWLTSAGNAEKVQTGSKTMLFAALGLFVVFFSYIFLNLLLGFLGTGNVAPVVPSPVAAVVPSP